MNLVSIPANPVPEGAITGTLKTPRRRGACALRAGVPPPGRKGTVCLFQGRAEFIEKYFETVRDLRARGFAVATLDWRGQGLSDRALADPRKGHVGDFAEYEHRSRNLHAARSCCPIVRRRMFALGHSMGAHRADARRLPGQRWFDRIVLSAPMIALPASRDSALSQDRGRDACGLLGFGSAYVPGGDATVIATRPFVGNPLTSDPVRYARIVAVLEAEPALGIGSPTVAWARRRLPRDGRDSPSRPIRASIRQPLLLIAAGRDEIVSTPAIEDIRGAAARRLASHRRRRPARADDGAGSLSRAVLGGVRRLRARHADVLNDGHRRTILSVRHCRA